MPHAHALGRPHGRALFFGAAATCALAAAVGCGRTTAPAAGGKPTVAFVTNNASDFWSIAQRGTEKAADEFDVNVEFRIPPSGTAAEQRDVVEDLLVKGVSGIAISPKDAENQAPWLNDVADEVALVTHDSDLPSGSNRLCYIGTENYLAGRAAGELIKEALPDGGDVVIFVGTMDAQNAQERHQGVLDELAGAKGAVGPEVGAYRILATMTDEASPAKAKANVEDALVKYGAKPGKLCLVGLWAYNPPAMLSAARGSNMLGKVQMVGFDENEETLQGIADGHMLGTVVQQPYKFGYEAVRVLAALARGDKSVLPADGVIHVPHRVIKADNVAEFRAELEQLKKPSAAAKAAPAA